MTTTFNPIDKLKHLLGSAMALVVIITSTSAYAQPYSIAAGTVNACASILEDTGGPSAPYSDNENFTVVICPDVPGDAISLTWVLFNLSTQGAQNTWDAIEIWDGNST